MPPRLRAIAPPNILQTSSSCSSSACRSSPAVRQFSSTASLDKRARVKAQPTRQRRLMYRWLDGVGSAFRDPLPGSTNYLSAYNNQGVLLRSMQRSADQGDATGPNKTGASDSTTTGSMQLLPERTADLKPFPLNRDFRSQPVTSEELREGVWSKVMKDGQSVATVSAELGVDMNRVGAIVRLKEIEKEWIRKRTPLATAYGRAVLAMLPQTPYNPEEYRNKPHESINDLPVHAATMQQIFHPTSESRRFTRTDAAAVFKEGLKPADDRVPHPELAVLERERLAGVPLPERIQRAQVRNDEQQRIKSLAEEKRKRWEAKALTVVDTNRWAFRFKEISVEAAGKDGRGRHGVGARYGIPHEDRKRGQTKIPTRV